MEERNGDSSSYLPSLKLLEVMESSSCGRAGVCEREARVSPSDNTLDKSLLKNGLLNTIVLTAPLR